MITCTEISAHWCPLCGDCTCQRPEESLDDEDCPLHNSTSPHGETEPQLTAWGHFGDVPKQC